MTTRITVPTNHVALLLPRQLADELQAMAIAERRRLLSAYQRNLDTKPDYAQECRSMAKLWGDVLLALLEAQS